MAFHGLKSKRHRSSITDYFNKRSCIPPNGTQDVAANTFDSSPGNSLRQCSHLRCASQTCSTKCAENLVNVKINLEPNSGSVNSIHNDDKSAKNVGAEDPCVLIDPICPTDTKNFDKDEWVSSLVPESRTLLEWEIQYLHISWLEKVYAELTKPYFLNLKKFLALQQGKTVFPAAHQVYSWSHLTPLPEVKCLILGQDPYHNHNQAHGLAFSVLEPTRPPPSLKNIYKTLTIDFPSFQAPEYNTLYKHGRPGGGNLTQWAQRGVLLLNTCLTVEAHKANSHSKKGWEQFTEEVIRAAINYHCGPTGQGFVIMAWGVPAQLRIEKICQTLSSDANKLKVIATVHPSPLSAHRGFFELNTFKRCNEWLNKHGLTGIDWGLVKDNIVI